MVPLQFFKDDLLQGSLGPFYSKPHLSRGFTLPGRGVFKTQSKIYDGAFFAKIVHDFQSSTIFAKKFYHRCSTMF